MAYKQNRQFKIVLVGPEKVGKTAFVQKYRTKRFEKFYIPTLRVEVYSINLDTNYGNIIFKIWNCAELCEEYYTNARGAIIMIDNTSKLSVNSVPSYLETLRRVNPNMQIVLCSNKVDNISNKQMTLTYIQDFAKNLNIEQVIQISVKSNYNFDKPFLYLLQKLVNEDCEVIIE